MSAARRSDRFGVVDRIALVGVALCVLYAGLVLFTGPLRGLADNGDGYRTMAPAGVTHEAPIEAFRHRFVRRDHRVGAPSLASHPSSGALLVRLATYLPWPGVSAGHLALRQLGAVHAGLALLFVLLALARGVAPAGVLVPCLAILTSECLLLWNGTHPDAAATLGFFGLLLGLQPGRGDRRPRLRALALGLAALLVGTSARAYLLVPWLATLVVVTRRPIGARALRLAAMLGVIGVLGAWLYTAGPGHRFPAINDFHAVHRGLAWVADDRDAVLRELGLPASSRALVGRTYFAGEVPRRDAEALAQLSRPRLLLGYLRRPSACARVLRRLGDTLGDPRPIQLGSYARSAAHPERTPPGVGPSLRALRTRLGPPLLSVGLVLLASLALLVRRGARGAAPTFAILVVVVQCGVAVLGDGLFSLRRHLLLPGLALDALLGWTILDLVRRASIAARLRDRHAHVRDAEGQATEIVGPGTPRRAARVEADPRDAALEA